MRKDSRVARTTILGSVLAAALQIALPLASHAQSAPTQGDGWTVALPRSWSFDAGQNMARGTLASGAAGNFVISHQALPTPAYDVPAFESDLKESLPGVTFGPDVPNRRDGQPAVEFVAYGSSFTSGVQLWIEAGQVWSIVLNVASTDANTANTGFQEIWKIVDSSFFVAAPLPITN